MNSKLLAILGLFITQHTFAGEDVDLSKSADSAGLIKIKNIRGDITISGWDKDEISIEGELDDLAEKLIFEVDGKRSVIEVVMPRRNINWGDGSDLEIKLPKNSRVDFVGVSTDVEVTNVLGGLRIKSVSGDVETENITGQLMISSVSGEIKIDESEGSLHASTVSGNLDILRHIGGLELESMSGDIEVNTLENDKLRIQSVSGEIDVTCDIKEGAYAELQSISGEIELELVGNVGAKFNLDAGISGDIDNNLSNKKASESMIGSKTLDMMTGDGSATVVIRTVSADIKVE